MKTIEECRKHWKKIAKENGWDKEPFYVQIWKNKKGEIIDSVSFRGLDRDIIMVET